MKNTIGVFFVGWTKGSVFPSTKAQTAYFLKYGYLDMLNADDVEVVEVMLNKHGFKDNYKYTRSKQAVRLQNMDELQIALKEEYYAK